nr:Chain C, SYNTHETIC GLYCOPEPTIDE [Respirovirus muris]
FAPSNYPAL